MYLHLAAVTGARPGEMCGLRWSDIDAERAELRISRRILEVQPEPKVQDLTKTGKTRRIPLDRTVLAVLAQCPRRSRSDRRDVPALRSRPTLRVQRHGRRHGLLATGLDLASVPQAAPRPRARQRHRSTACGIRRRRR